jgi:pSer/pThr/pTyr-binding forkhead associated (FHA) protein
MSGTILFILRIAMVVALYAFLGLVLITLWNDLKRSSQAVSSYLPPLMTISLEKGKEVESRQFQTSEITLGRDPTCECPLEDATVSARHARLYYRQGHWWVEDLQSTNGTYINGELISTPLVLTPGDLLRCGQVSLTLKIGEPGL